MSEHAPAACREILAQIAAYLDGDLAATECLAIETHCQACEPCAALVSGLRQTVGLCRDAAQAPLPDEVRRRALESVRRILQDGR